MASQLQPHSQSQSQMQATEVSNVTSLTLRKFSHVTTSSLHSKFLWTHLSHSNLQATFDYLSVTNSQNLLIRKRLLRISQGQEVLDQIYFDDIAYLARLDEERSRSQPIPDADRLTLIIIKRPFLAIRYRLQNGQIRRIQLNFDLENGYDVAVRHLTDYGLPVRDRNLDAQQAAVTQPKYPDKPMYPNDQSSTNPDLSQSISKDTLTRGTTSTGSQFVAQPSAGYNFQPFLRPTQDYQMTTHAASQPIEPFMSGAIPSSQVAGSIRPGLPTVYPQGHRTQDYGEGSMFGPPLQHPQSHQETSYRGLEQSDPLCRRLFEPAQKAAAPASYPRPDESNWPLLPPSRDSQVVAEESSSIRHQYTFHGNEQQTFDVEKSSGDIASQPAKPSKKPPTKKRQTTKSRKASALPAAKEPIDVNELDIDEVLSSPITKKSRHTRPSTAASKSTTRLASPPPPNAPAKVAKKPAPKRKLPTTATQATQTEPTPTSQSTPAAGQTTSHPHPQTTLSVAEEWQHAVSQFVERFKNQPAPSPPKSPPPAARPVSDLREYASRPGPERRAAIDEMIMELIGDPGFETLCEDVEGAWVRIGLGM